MPEDNEDYAIIEEYDGRAPAEIADRDRGILTKNDRKYFFGELDLEGQDERNIRYRIRQRVIEGLLDLDLLGSYMSLEDKKQVINDDRIGEILPIDLLILAYQMRLYDESVSNVRDRFEHDVQAAIEAVENAENDEYVISDVDIEIERKDSGLENLEKRLLRGIASPTEAAAYLQQAHGQYNSDAVKRATQLLSGDEE